MKNKCASAVLVGALYVAQETALTYKDTGDTSRNTPNGVVFATTTAGTSAGVEAAFVTQAYVPDTIIDVEYPKPVPERPTLTIQVQLTSHVRKSRRTRNS